MDHDRANPPPISGKYKLWIFWLHSHTQSVSCSSSPSQSLKLLLLLLVFLLVLLHDAAGAANVTAAAVGNVFFLCFCFQVAQPQVLYTQSRCRGWDNCCQVVFVWFATSIAIVLLFNPVYQPYEN